MRIEKYGIADTLGYGLLVREDYVTPCFVQLVRLECKSQNTSKVFSKTIDALGKQTNARVEAEVDNTIGGMFLKSDKSYRTKTAPVPQYNMSNVYVVYDSDAHSWREYFTGIELIVASLSCVDDKNTLSLSSRAPGIVIDVGRKLTGIYDTVSITEPKICDSITFSEGVNKLTEAEIRERAEELFNIKKYAEMWGEGYDHATKDIKNERQWAEKGMPNVEKDLASGFGQYANMGSSRERTTPQSSRDENKSRQSNQQRNSGGPVSEQLRQEWKRKGRCVHCGGELMSGSIVQGFKCCRVCGRMNK